MRRYFLILTLAACVATAAFSQSPNMAAGLEFGVREFNPEGANAMDTGWLRPMFTYENNLADRLNLYAEVGLPLWFSSYNDGFWLGADLTLSGAYTLNASPSGALSFMLESATAFDFNGNGVYAFFPAPRGRLFRHLETWEGMPAGDKIATSLGLGVGYTHQIQATIIFAQANIAFFLFGDGDDVPGAFDDVNVDFSIGVNTPFPGGNFGYTIGLNMNIKEGGNSPADILQYLYFIPSFEFSSVPVYIEVEVGVPMVGNGMDYIGLSIIPEFRYQATYSLNLYVNIPVSGIGVDGGTIGMGLDLGVMFNF